MDNTFEPFAVRSTEFWERKRERYWQLYERPTAEVLSPSKQATLEVLTRIGCQYKAERAKGKPQ